MLCAAVTLVAFASGNNLLYLIAAPLWAAAVAAPVLGHLNLRGLTADRELPAELFAGSDGAGRLVVRSRRRWIPAVALEVCEGDGGPTGSIARVEPRRAAAVRVSWRFARRGPRHLRGLEISSGFPFGLTRHSLQLHQPVDLLVYPAPLPGTPPLRGEQLEGASRQGQAAGGTGDFHGLRPYRPGDRPRSVHWPTSARAQDLLVVERTRDADPIVEVVVHPRQPWERELSRATGEIVRAFARGRMVRLRLGGRNVGHRQPARADGAWRRSLLDALARMPEDPP